MSNIRGFILMAASELENASKIIEAFNCTDEDVASITKRQVALAKKLRVIARYLRPSPGFAKWNSGTAEAMKNLKIQLKPPSN